MDSPTAYLSSSTLSLTESSKVVGCICQLMSYGGLFTVVFKLYPAVAP